MSNKVGDRVGNFIIRSLDNPPSDDRVVRIAIVDKGIDCDCFSRYLKHAGYWVETGSSELYPKNSTIKSCQLYSSEFVVGWYDEIKGTAKYIEKKINLSALAVDISSMIEDNKLQEAIDLLESIKKEQV